MAKEDVVKMQIKRVEKELRDLPHHKGTDHHIGRLRAKLAILEEKLESPSGAKGGGGGGYAVKKQGDATVVLVGPPSAGKSTLLNLLTNAESKVAAYAFTTLTVIPGMMDYKNAKIQILDVPGLIEGAQEGKGRGKEVLAVARNCDLIVFMTDPDRLDFFKKLVKELEQAGIRINKIKPQIKIEKKTNGGLYVHTNLKQDLDKETVKEVATEFGIKNGEITVNEKLTMERLIDAFSKNRVYIPAIYVVNKSDTLDKKENEKIDTRILRISADKNTGIEEMRQKVWEKLNFINVFLFNKANEEFDEIKIVKNGITLQELGESIGDKFLEGKTAAKIYGKAAKFEGQEVSLTIKVVDGMKIRFI
ncbi:MAG TPA: GTPase [Patescibacteria group bacterium]|nr:GTPase [Patescibacteria group bacterium]